MKRILPAIVALLGLFIAVGCGIPEEDYNKSQQDLASSQTALQASQDELKKTKQSLDECENDLEESKRSLVNIDEDYKELGDKHSELDAAYAETKEALDRIRKANKLRQKAMDELLAKFAALIESGKLSIGVNDGRMVIHLPSNVLFAVGKSSLSKNGKKALKEVAEVLKTIETRKFQVAGHTDNQRGKSRVNPNWTLSYKRARAVFDLLVKEKFDESRLSLAAYAEFSPVASNETKEGKEKNRRIEIVLLPTSDELPLKQLKKIKKIDEKIENAVK